MNKLVRGIGRVFLALGSLIMWILSFKVVRNWLWSKAEKKGKEKIVDAKAKIVKGKGDRE